MSFYIPSIPQADDDPKVSQGQILGNFTRLNTDFNVDHVQFSASTNRGQHRKITFQNVLGVDPDKAANIASLYTKTFAGDPELFFQNNNTSADVFQLTNLDIPSTGTNYKVTTPWGLQIAFGRGTGGSITFQGTGFTAGTTIISAILTGIGASNPQVGVVTLTGLTYTPNGPGDTVYYLVFGLLP